MSGNEAKRDRLIYNYAKTRAASKYALNSDKTAQVWPKNRADVCSDTQTGVLTLS